MPESRMRKLDVTDRTSDPAPKLKRVTGDFYDFRRRSRRREGLGSVSEQGRNGVCEDGERLKCLFVVPSMRVTISAKRCYNESTNGRYLCACLTTQGGREAFNGTNFNRGTGLLFGVQRSPDERSESGRIGTENRGPFAEH